jgi:hypothetical protein
MGIAFRNQRRHDTSQCKFAGAKIIEVRSIRSAMGQPTGAVVAFCPGTFFHNLRLILIGRLNGG